VLFSLWNPGKYNEKINNGKKLDNTKDLSNNVYVKKELFSIKIYRWGREGSNIMYRVFAVSEDASAFITITLLFNFSRFFLNSKTTIFFGL